MKWKLEMPAPLVLLALLLSHNAWALPQDPPDKPKADAPKTEDKKRASIQIRFSSEDEPTLPSGSKIQWNGEDSSCRQSKGGQPIGPGGVTSLEVPVCRIKIAIFITGINVKTVTLDLPKNTEKLKDSIRIIVKREGEPQVDWKP